MRTSLRFVLLAVVTSLVWPFSLYGAPLYKITVQIDPTGGGTVLLDPQKDGYAKNNIVDSIGLAGDRHDVYRLGRRPERHAESNHAARQRQIKP